MAMQYGVLSPSPTLHPSSSVPSSGLLKEKESEGKLSGFIFLCSGQTKPECYRYRVFGLPNGQVDVVEKIEPGTILFLFDFGVKRLYGIYAATSKGGMNLEPAAFSGKFQAQVRFKILSDSLPLHEQAFKHAIKDNYQGSKFRQELSGEQKYTPETYARKHVQAAPHRIIQQSPLPSHSYPKYLAEAPTLYLPEKATLSTYDPNRSYEIALEMDRRNGVHGLYSQLYASTLPNSRSTADLANYNSQYLPPATTSHVSLQPQAMAPMYTVATPPHLQASSLLHSHQSYYPPPTHVGESQVYHDPSHQSYYPPPTHVGESQVYLDHLQSSIHGSSGEDFNFS
ncbi:hypothetical protein Tsubulata_043898 [Turnera subulata]|uniref:DCD domain-containing protein n=1 Tax=Turnera subulata TaxID=218843 RepID=A0A9Q0JDP7_9ROSI|nr:hypothetical protein Tsubulata_043898 [Turnera subulata]